MVGGAAQRRRLAAAGRVPARAGLIHLQTRVGLGKSGREGERWRERERKQGKGEIEIKKEAESQTTDPVTSCDALRYYYAWLFTDDFLAHVTLDAQLNY